MGAIDKGTGARFVDETGYAAGELENIINGGIGENILFTTGKVKVCPDIFRGLMPIHVSDAALDVDSLADGSVGLELELFPEFCLSGKDESHRALRIHFEVKQESDFFQHLLVE